jgi:hypothetical protein
VLAVTVPDSVTDVDAGCFPDCRQLRDVAKGLGLRTLPERLVKGCVRLCQLMVASVIEAVRERALVRAKALRGSDFSRLAPRAEIGRSAFSGSGLLSLSLPGRQAARVD